MTLIANLRHAASNRETVLVGGGEFGPTELRHAADLLEAAPFMLDALRALLDMPEFDGTAETSKTRRQAKHAARNALALATGGTA